MTFNSYTFIVFFAVVLLLQRMPVGWRSKKAMLLVASYVFYAAWNPPFVVLLWISTVVDWFVAKGLANATETRSRKTLLSISLCSNLGMLGFFKYGNFLQENFAEICRMLGFEFHPATWNIVLPMGISFYTFQTLSYTLDIYFRRMKPCSSFLDYALYVTFFPQLVAGPIVRASEFLHQCVKEITPSSKQLGWGATLLTIGIFQKVVLADGVLAPVTEFVFDTHQTQSTISAWAGTLAFAGQIFFDFSGYSTCAIGAASCLGFSLPRNFRFPYAAIGFSDFWKRWHISLSSWLRDYLYIPLGGNRQGPTRTHVNLMLTMLLGGLWHGASWTFVVWGGLHGLYLIGERLCVRLQGHVPFWKTTPGRLLLAAFTFVLVCFTWVFFRADTFSQAFAILRSMIGFVPGGEAATVHKSWMGISMLCVASLLVIQWKMRDSTLEAQISRLPLWIKAPALALMLVLIATVSGEDRAFIYFQF